jgi:transposase
VFTRGHRVAKKALYDIRLNVVRAIEKGLHPEDVALAHGCGRSTVYAWWRTYEQHGEDGLSPKQVPGPAGKLTERQVAELYNMVVGKDPRQLQFDFALWTRAMVQELVRSRFGIDMTLQGIGKLLRRIGLSPQRPLVRAYEQDPERVRRWKEEEYPAIRAEAEAVGAQIFFCDEAGVRTDHHSGRTWAEVGCTPIVLGTGNRKSLNMISAVSPTGKLHFAFVGLRQRRGVHRLPA